MKHHHLGPSNFPNWEKCPVFEYDRQMHDDLAKRGTLMHKALEMNLKGKPADYSEIDEDGIRAVQWATHFILHRRSAADTLLLEQRVTYKEPDAFADGGENEVYFGTSDVILIQNGGKLARIMDFKSGFDGDYQAQIAGYGLALFCMRPRLQLIEGHYLLGQSKKHFSFLMTRDQAAARILPIIQSRQAVLEANESERWEYAATDPSLCGKCALRGDCPRLRDLAGVREGGAQKMLPVIPPPSSGEIVMPGHLGYAMDVAKAAEEWAKIIKERVTEYAKQGITPLGYKLIKREGSWEVSDAEGLLRSVLEEFNSHDVLKLLGLSKADVVKILKETGMSAKDAAEEFEASYSQFFKQGEESQYLKVAK